MQAWTHFLKYTYILPFAYDAETPIPLLSGLLSVSASPEHSLKLLSHLRAPKGRHCGYCSHPLAPDTKSSRAEISKILYYIISYYIIYISYITYFSDINLKIQN